MLPCPDDILISNSHSHYFTLFERHIGLDLARHVRYDGATDSSHVFFGSINLEDGAGFYPGDGAGDLPITGGPPPFSSGASGAAAVASSSSTKAPMPLSPKSPISLLSTAAAPPPTFPPGSACAAQEQEIEAASVLRQHIVRMARSRF